MSTLLHAALASFGRHLGSVAFLVAMVGAAGLYAHHVLRRLKRTLHRGRRG